MNTKKNKFEIDAIARLYMIQKRILKEYDLGLTYRTKEQLENARRLIKKVTLIMNDLDESSKFIIKNEIVLGKKGSWYYGFLSVPTYYRHRNKAYKDFLTYMEQ